MKALVVFDTNFGNTKLIADRIAKQLGNDTPSVSVNDLREHSLDEIDLLIVGSPINAWKPTEKITAFLNRLSAVMTKGMKAAAFDTRVKFILSGNAGKKIARALKNSGANVIVPPMAFYVAGNEGPLLEGEIEKAEEWASSIKSNT